MRERARDSHCGTFAAGRSLARDTRESTLSGTLSELIQLPISLDLEATDIAVSSRR